MKTGDRILIDGLQPATIKAARTPAEMIERLPMLSEIFYDAAESGADLVAIVTLEAEPEAGHNTSVIIHTAEGWETADGRHIEVRTIPHTN
jgi:hypothetical protein